MYGCENGWPGAAQNYLGVLGAWPWSVFPAYLHSHNWDMLNFGKYCHSMIHLFTQYDY